MANNNSTKILNYIARTINPLRNLTQQQINQMFESARHGNDVRMQLAFYEIERSMPIFGICLNKRLSAITTRAWDVLPDVDSDVATAQAETIKKIFRKSERRNKDGLTECLKHLGLASFRGRAAVKPFIEDGNLIFKKLQNWNVLEFNDELYWNPNAEYECPQDGHLTKIPDSEIMCLKEERAIDIPGLIIYLRQIVGEEQWSRFVEKCGLPQVILTVDDSVTQDKLPEFEARALNIFNGGSGVLPNSCHLQELTAARGQDPFSAYCEHQMRLIAILACGSTGAVLGDVGAGLGSDVVSTQEQNFQNLVTADCKKIENTLNEITISKICRELLKQDPVCSFKFIETDLTSPADYIEMAMKLSSLGIKLDVAKLKELTKLSFIDDEQTDIWKPE